MQFACMSILIQITDAAESAEVASFARKTEGSSILEKISHYQVISYTTTTQW